MKSFATSLFACAALLNLAACAPKATREASAPVASAPAAAVPDTSQVTPAPVATVPVNKTCPVQRGNPVNPNIATVEYQGKTYGFCCADCPAKFKADPEKYLKDFTDDGGKGGEMKGMEGMGNMKGMEGMQHGTN
jgi:hypothetical protein